MGGNAELRTAMHLMRTDLHLKRTTILIQQYGMKRLIPVCLGAGDVVIEFRIHGLPVIMQKPQHGVTLGLGIHQDTKGADIHELIEGQPFGNHLAVNTVEMLGPTRYFACDSSVGEKTSESSDCCGHKGLALLAAFIELIGNRSISLGLGHAKGKILERPFQLPDAKPIGQRRMHQQGLFTKYTSRLHEFRRWLLKRRRQRLEMCDPKC